MRYAVKSGPFTVVLTPEGDDDRRVLEAAGPSSYLTRRFVDGELHISSVSIVQQVAELIRQLGRAATISEVSESLGLARSRVSTAVDTLKEQNLVERCGRGTWRWTGESR